MPFKKSDDGKQLVLSENGLPIFVGSDGSESPYDVDVKAKQIAELTAKKVNLAKEVEELKAKYAILSEIEDLAAYVEEHKKNAETIASMDEKDREKEASVQKRIDDARKSAVEPVAKERDKLRAELEAATANLSKAVIGNAFGQSKYAAEKLVNVALARQLFEGSFYVKDGKAIGRDADGNDLYGANGVATFDEALDRLVKESPFKDNILKAAFGGSGGNGNETKLTNSSGKLSYEDAAKLSPAEYAKARKEGRI